MTERTNLIPARLKSAVVGGHVAGAEDIIDDVKGKTQDVINSDVDTAIGDDDIEGSIKGRIKSLEESIGPGGSVEEQINAKIATLDASVSQAAGTDGLALSVTEVDGKVTGISGSIAANTYDAYGSVAAEATRAQAAEEQNASDIDAIEEKIPSQASSTNQLADKEFVNSSISTNTATFRGTSAAGLTETEFLAWADALTKDDNDYVFWNTADSAGNTQFKRYKYNGTAWVYEYTLNNSSFTSEQWAAIQSGMTSSLTTKLSALPTNAELTEALAGKQAVISDLDTIRSGASAGATAYQKPSTGIPSTDLTTGVQTSLGKADTAYQLPSGGMPSTDMASAVQTSLGKADTAVQPADLATVATSGSYNDLDDKPTIPVVPTNVSAFTNDAGYLTEHQSLAGYYTKTETNGLLDDKQATLVSGTNIKTINSQSLLGSGDIVIQGGGTYTGGNGIDITNDEISVKAGSNLSFDANGNLNATDTTYSVMGGSGASHASGLVPDPGATAGTTKYLREDGTWQEVSALPEVEIGSETPVEDVKLFVDEDADPASAIDIYTKAQTDTLLDGKLSNPIELTSLSGDYVFKDGDTLVVGTGLYKCNVATTTTPPFDFVFDANGSIVIDSINGCEAVVVDSDTLNTGWEKVADVSDRHYTEMRVATKADKATTAAGYGIIDVYTKNQIDALTRHTRLTDFDLNVLKKAVADQNLEKYGLKVGDQKTINGHTYVIADLNTMKGTRAPYRVTTNHVGLIVFFANPNDPLAKTKWNASGNTYTGADSRGAGYLNSDLHYYLKNTLLPLVEADLGASNLLGHSKQLTNAINTTAVNRMANDSYKGASSGCSWEADCKICALSEVQVCGGAVLSSSGFDTCEACRQLEVFQRYSHTEIFGNEFPWLRDVASASLASLATNNGTVDSATASYDFHVAALVLFH